MRAASVVAGRFEIERLAGAGGMGSVYRARDRETDRTVALKVLKTGSEEGRSRFEREAHVLARLSHPAIVDYVAQGETESGDMFLVMEWLEGESLSERLSQRGLSVRESVALGRRVAAALAFAHASGIVHRDVKPSNVFLPAGSIDGAKLVDFGIAHLAVSGSELTRTGAMLGTPAYMAPEQARGERGVDARADVFSLGAMLYRCLTGRAPFAAEDAFGMLLKVMSEPLTPPSAVRPALPADLDDLVVRMLAKAPAERPRDGAAVVAAIEALGPVGDAGAPPLHARGPVLAQGDRRMVSIVAIATPPPAGAEVGARSAASIDAIAARYRGRVERIAEGRWTILLGESGQETTVSTGRSTMERVLAPTDLAMRAARCALAVHLGARREARVAVASGRFARELATPAMLADGAFDLLDTEAGGPVRIDDMTASLLDARFEVGKDGARLALTGERGGDEIGRTLLGRATPCVGREQELVTLEAALAASVEEAVARAVLVLGAAGMGKSRLRAELLLRVRKQRSEVSIWMGTADAIGHFSSYSLLSSALRKVFGGRQVDDPAAAGAALAAAIARRVPAADQTRLTEFLGALAGVEPADGSSHRLRAARRDPRLMADQIRLAWEDFVVAECAERPVLLVLEDVHWADAASIELCDAALRRMQNGPFMVLALGRPEALETFPGLFRARDVQEIRLGPLSRRASERLAREVLGARSTGDEIAALVDRAAGNAFYLEELIRAVAEGAGAALPESVRAMIEARLATLEQNARRIVRAASVFGQTFWRGGVRAMLGGDVSAETIDEHLADLVRRELCTRVPLPRFADDVEYAFRHALVRDASYATLSEEDATVCHALAAEWLESAGERRGNVVAEHFERGGLPHRAVAGYVRAAEQALEGNDPVAAVRWTERAIGCGAAGEALGRALWIQAEGHNWHGKVEAAERAALAAMEWLARGSAPFYAAAGEAAVASSRCGHTDTLLALVPELLHAAAAGDALDEQVHAVAGAAIQLLFRACFEQADALFAWLDRAVTRAVDLDTKVAGPVAEACAWRALFAGDPALYLTLSSTAASAYEGIGDVRNGARALLNVGYGCLQVGDHEEAEVSLRHALLASERLGAAAQVVRHNLGLVLARLGRTEEAVEMERAALAACDPASGRMIAACHLYLALIHQTAGQLTDAEHHVAHAVDPGLAPHLAAYALAVQAMVRLGLGRAADAAAPMQQAIELLGRVQRIDEGEAYIRLAHAEVLFAIGDTEGAHRAIEDAWARLETRAQKIADVAVRERFLTRVPENARTAELAKAWLGR